MANRIYCKTVSKGRQAFYLEANGKRYYLFEQDYRVSNKEHFANGITVSEALALRANRSTAVSRTAEKLCNYIRYIEREYEIVVLQKTQKNKQTKKSAKTYKRESFNWRNTDWDIA